MKTVKLIENEKMTFGLIAFILWMFYSISKKPLRYVWKTMKTEMESTTILEAIKEPVYFLLPLLIFLLFLGKIMDITLLIIFLLLWFLNILTDKAINILSKWLNNYNNLWRIYFLKISKGGESNRAENQKIGLIIISIITLGAIFGGIFKYIFYFVLFTLTSFLLFLLYGYFVKGFEKVNAPGKFNIPILSNLFYPLENLLLGYCRFVMKQVLEDVYPVFVYFMLVLSYFLYSHGQLNITNFSLSLLLIFPILLKLSMVHNYSPAFGKIVLLSGEVYDKAIILNYQLIPENDQLYLEVLIKQKMKQKLLKIPKENIKYLENIKVLKIN